MDFLRTDYLKMKPTYTAHTKEHENAHEVSSDRLKTTCEASHDCHKKTKHLRIMIFSSENHYS